MPNFALITEGITDQVIIERIINTVITHLLDDEPEVRILQPLRDATDQSRQAGESFGGWERVLEYCNDQYLLDALEFNEFIVIQIDTDCCDHPNFGIESHHGGEELDTADLIAAVRRRLERCFTQDFIEVNGDRIIFAIAVHSTECWLMPRYSTTANDKKRERSCEVHLNRALTRANESYEKTFTCYNRLATCFRKHRDLLNYKRDNLSLGVFVDSLTSKVST